MDLQGKLKMKRFLGIVGLLFVSVSLNADDTESSKQFTIIGKYVTPSVDISADTSSVEEETGTASDWSVASVVVSFETVNEEGNNETVELASGMLVDGRVELTGEIDEPMMVTITASKGDGQETLKRTVVIEPGDEAVSFAIVDRQVDYRRVQLAMIGTSSRVRDNTRKFTLKGNFRSMQDELSLGIITLNGPGFNTEGKLSRVTHGSVLLEDGMFSIESEIHEPSLMRVVAQAGEDAFNEYFGAVEIVVEPDSEIVIEPRGWSRELVATAESGRHDRLVDSWQQSEPYQALLNEYAKSYKDFRDAWEASWRARQAAAQATTEEETATTNADNDTNLSEETEPTEEINDEDEPVLAYSNGKPAATGCEHVELADANSETTQDSSESENPEYHKLFLELVKMRVEALEQIASITEDPMDLLLALELGAYGYNSDNIKESIPLYDKVASMVDEEMAERRVRSARDEIADFIEVDEIDKSLVPGQVSPNFSLPTLEGVGVEFHDLVAEKDIVLIDFWASWCGPCIAAFPHLKELYSSYGDNGFEIVAINLDRTQEIWAEASDEHDLPWMDLGDISEKGEGTVAKAYGVKFLPKSFLIDNHGCINHRELSSEELERVLKARYGDTATSDDADS